MAQLRFYVSRRGSEKIECVATVPGKVDLAKFEGGKIVVKTPKGERQVSIPGFIDLALASMVIELQNGVRDYLLPLNPTKPSNGSGKRTRYTD